MFVFAVLIYVRVNHGLPAKMEIEISANSAAWKLNQYILFSLTHTHGHCTCLTVQQWSVQRTNNRPWIPTGTAGKCQKPLARGRTEDPLLRSVAERRRGKRTQVGKTYDLTFQEVHKRNAPDIRRHRAKKYTIHSWERSHVHVHWGRACASHFADPRSAHMDRR